MKRLLFFLLACLPLSLPAGGRERPEELRLEVEFFADSLRAGRAMGSPGLQAVTFYLVRQLRDAGLQTSVQSFVADGRIGRNVVAVTPGSFSKYVVVGAYLDGLGTLDGTLYPGADANASGLAALLALAREFNDGRKRSTGLVFVAFDGGEWEEAAGLTAGLLCETDLPVPLRRCSRFALRLRADGPWTLRGLRWEVYAERSRRR